MAPVVGEKCGPYQILSQIGQGGMGVVYKAADTRLGRTVALKFLKVRASDRFEREAKAVSLLNHPNIATLYDVGTHEGQPYLVMEFVEGAPLQGPLPFKDAVKAAIQIADALAVAHSAGIVHRDLKPANIMIAAKGTIKILDFGLAKLEEQAADALDTTITATTETAEGTVIGTVAYMSPEQAEGKKVDARSDIFSFGSVLYELVTGHRAFGGATAISTISAVLLVEPKPIQDVPPELEKIIRRCLRKDPELRMQHMADVAVLLREIDLEPAAAQPDSKTSRTVRIYQLVAAASLLIAAVAAGMYYTATKLTTRGTPHIKFELGLSSDLTHPGFDTSAKPALSPNGRQVAFVREGKLWLRDLSSIAPHVIAGTEGASSPFWSPDSQSVAFLARQLLRKVNVRSGSLTTIGEIPNVVSSFLGGTWSRSGSILVGIEKYGLYETSERGGRFVLVRAPDPAKGEYDFHGPHYLPDGRAYLFTMHPTANWKFTLCVSSGQTTRCQLEGQGEVASAGVYDRRGYLLYERMRQGKSILAAPFSVNGLHVAGEPFVVAETGGGPSVSDDGMLLYASGGSTRAQELVMLDRTGRLEQVLSQPFDSIRSIAVSPDATRVAYSGSLEGNSDLWVSDLMRKTNSRLTSAAEIDQYAAWSPSGDSIAYSSGPITASRLMQRRSDGSGNIQPLAPPEQNARSPAWAPDGRSIVYTVFRADTRPELWMTPREGSPAPRLLFEAGSVGGAPAFSRDGRYIAYASDESGRTEVYVRPFLSGTGKWLISPNGGHNPRWNRKGNELFYLEGNSVMSVPVATMPGFRAGQPKRLFSGEQANVVTFTWIPTSQPFDITPDGQHFVFVRMVGGMSKDSVTIIQNWLLEFQR